MDFSLTDAALMASRGRATSMGFFLQAGVVKTSKYNVGTAEKGFAQQGKIFAYQGDFLI